MRRPRTHRESVVAHIKHDLNHIRFSICSEWENYPADEVLKVLRNCAEIENIVKSISLVSLTPNAPLEGRAQAKDTGVGMGYRCKRQAQSVNAVRHERTG